MYDHTLHSFIRPMHAAGAFVSFAGGFRSSGAQVKRPSQKVQAALRKKFGGNETDEEDDGLLHIREQERTALAAEDSGPAEDAFEFDSDPDSDSDYDANAQAHGTYDSEDSDGIGAVYGRNPAVGAPSTSGQVLLGFLHFAYFSPSDFLFPSCMYATVVSRVTTHLFSMSFIHLYLRQARSGARGPGTPQKGPQGPEKGQEKSHRGRRRHQGRP